MGSRVGVYRIQRGVGHALARVEADDIWGLWGSVLGCIGVQRGGGIMQEPEWGQKACRGKSLLGRGYAQGPE